MENIKIINASFLNVIANLKWLFFDLFCCENYFDKNVLIILLIWSTENNYKKQLYKLWQLYYEFIIKLTEFLVAFTNL